ncbi:MAG TPA: type II toxin-antitoxin system ParD family antitoxin [Thermomicrobiales bacterium]|nr:type II toxin-antitoxin system ParD family antitoxin [Thermomicrobiales bacterium]
MNVRLTPHLEALVRSKIESGRYSDVSEVFEEALRLLEARDRLERLRAAVAIGNAQFASGEFEEWSPELMDRLEREADENARLGLPIDDAVTP